MVEVSRKEYPSGWILTDLIVSLMPDKRRWNYPGSWVVRFDQALKTADGNLVLAIPSVRGKGGKRQRHN